MGKHDSPKAPDSKPSKDGGKHEKQAPAPKPIMPAPKAPGK
jgi:hypothetical protein